MIKSKNPKIGIVLLAAGSAERMQKNKLLLNIGKKTLLENAVVAAQNTSARTTILVLGANENENRNAIKSYKVETVINENWKKGIGSSIKCGIQKMFSDFQETEAIIISVCDQPYLDKEIFEGLISTYIISGKKIVVSAYRQSIGVPVLYDRAFFNELLNIPDRYGAKKFVIEKADEDIITTFPFPKGEIDIDTIEDIKNLSPA